LRRYDEIVFSVDQIQKKGMDYPYDGEKRIADIPVEGDIEGNSPANLASDPGERKHHLVAVA
jgi:hypothetical protein